MQNRARYAVGTMPGAACSTLLWNCQPGEKTCNFSTEPAASAFQDKAPAEGNGSARLLRLHAPPPGRACRWHGTPAKRRRAGSNTGAELQAAQAGAGWGLAAAAHGKLANHCRAAGVGRGTGGAALLRLPWRSRPAHTPQPGRKHPPWWGTPCGTAASHSRAGSAQAGALRPTRGTAGLCATQLPAGGEPCCLQRRLPRRPVASTKAHETTAPA